MNRAVKAMPITSVETTAASALLTLDQWRAVAAHLGLSPRELQIAQGLVDSLDEFAIACQIGISQHTVHTYLKRMYQKTGAKRRCEFVVCLFMAYMKIVARSTAA